MKFDNARCHHNSQSHYLRSIMPYYRDVISMKYPNQKISETGKMQTTKSFIRSFLDSGMDPSGADIFEALQFGSKVENTEVSVAEINIDTGSIASP